jgi:UDP-GlcNAc:undecaprenyl-phosphate GlcNAc-1-phosphate transferase
LLSHTIEIPAAIAYVGAFVVSLLVTLLVTPMAARTASRIGLLDRPGPGKSHFSATPYLGGAAVASGLAVMGALVAGISLQIATILLCATVIAVLGLIDDVRGVRPSVKIVVEAAAAVALYFTGSGAALFGITWLDALVTVTWVVAITNSLNLLDNMDGIAPGVTAMSALGFFAISASGQHILVASLAAALVGASLGFLRYNFPPARVFLGDSGSLLAGFLLAALGLNLDLVGQVGVLRVAIPILVLAVPLFDTTLVILARIRGRRPIFVGGTDHASHRLAASGLSHRQVAILAIAIQGACSSAAFALHLASDPVVLAGATVMALLAAGALVATLRLQHPSVDSAGGDVILGTRDSRNYV